MSAKPPLAPASPKKEIHFREFVALCAALMALNALSIDPMLPALPDIARDLKIPHPNDRQLIISIYFLGLGVGTILFGVLSDRFGRKPVFAVAIALFILSTIACAGSQSFMMLLVGRACAGFFAASSRVIAVSIVRDRFHGDAMARVMSLIFTVFMIVPIVAPSFGQLILEIAPWRWIFWALAISATAILVWMLARLPETLRPENRLPISLPAIGRTIRTVVTTRQAIGYMLASGIMMSSVIGFIVSIQQIMFDVFDAARIFPIVFAGIAGGMAVGSLMNSRLVSRFGARRMSHTALLLFIIIAAIHITVILTGNETMVTFIGLQAMTMLTVAFTASNFSAISMEPFARGAGVASSFQAFLTTLVSVTLGSAIGRAFDGTTLPFTLGLMVFGSGGLMAILWAERGRLFTRPNHGMLRDPEFNALH